MKTFEQRRQAALAAARARLDQLHREIAALEAATPNAPLPPRVGRPKSTRLPTRPLLRQPPSSPIFGCGHPKTPENVCRYPYGDRCRACKTEQNARQYDKRAEAKGRHLQLVQPPRFVGTCKARDFDTGKRCTLPAHPGNEHSASGRVFFAALPEGAVPLRQLDARATAHDGNSWEVA